MWMGDNKWHYDYVRLAWDTGFSFEKLKSSNLDKNQICIVDIERIVKERDVGAVDRHIPLIIQYILEEEQIKILDANFVKIFKMSQLAVEFLLFCKKYLDNTVVLLKRELGKSKEEIRQLNDFIDELKSQLSKLARQQTVITFKCNICSKVFSSEDYLNSHVKRRHDKSENSETDKLNLEIKELKERLNNAEKCLKEKNELSPEKSNQNESEIGRLLKQFETFKEQVNIELRELRAQKEFYEENYTKLFDKIARTDGEEKPPREETVRFHCATQTEEIEQGDPAGVVNNVEDVIETKISTSLASIEGQIQTFGARLREIEDIQLSVRAAPETKQIEIKPKVKPRFKLTAASSGGKDGGDVEQIKREIARIEQELQVQSDDVKTQTLAGHSTEQKSPRDSEAPSESPADIGSEDEKTNESVKSASLSLSNSNALQSTQYVSNVKKEDIERLVNVKLQELGISEDWSGIPHKTFGDTLKTINHQAGLATKVYSNFYELKKGIENSVNEQCTKRNQMPPERVKSTEQNIVQVAYRTKQRKKSSNTVHIKNRELYETDTESESDFKRPETNYGLRSLHKFSEVINELKSTQLDESDSGPRYRTDTPKRVLKNFSSAASLSKKKVMFDLEGAGGKTVGSSSLEDQGEDPVPGSLAGHSGGVKSEDIDDFDLSDT